MFRTLDDYRKKEDDDEKDNRKTTFSYTGGKSSGISVENPEDFMQRSKRQGGDKKGFEKQRNKITLKVYKNGFIVDDGPFRSLTIKDNQDFMDDVKNGYIPLELINKGYKDLGIALDDKSQEEYIAPPPEKKFEAFAGKGSHITYVKTEGLVVNKNVSSSMDQSKPTCKVSIRLFNGEVVDGNFNLKSTVQDIFNFVAKSSGTRKFELLNGFPPKRISLMNKKIEDLGLQGTMLTQKLL